MSIQMPCV